MASYEPWYMPAHHGEHQTKHRQQQSRKLWPTDLEREEDCISLAGINYVKARGQFERGKLKLKHAL